MTTIDAVLLADAAIVENGKVYMHGGGWDVLHIDYFPCAVHALAVVVVLRVPPGDHEPSQYITLDLCHIDDPDTSVLPGGPLGGPFSVTAPSLATGYRPEDGITAPMVFSLDGVTFPRPGVYALRVRLNDGTDHVTRLTVYGPNYSLTAQTIGTA